MPKADNMLAVLWLLRSRRRVTARDIARELEITVRTAYRYIDALCASGVPVIADVGPEGGYSLPDSFRGVPVILEPHELKALFQAALFARHAGYPYAQQAESGLAKLSRTLSPGQADQLQREVGTMGAVPLHRGGLAAPWLEPLEQAVAHRATVRLRYQKAAAPEPEPREVDPYGLIYHGGLWYVVGRCHRRKSIREFRVDRIHGIEATGAHFEPPAEFRPEAVFDSDWVGSQAAAGPFTTVRLTGAPAALTQLAEHWYLGHCRPERNDAELRLQLNAGGMDQLLTFLLAHGAAVTVLEPDDLRRRLAAAALRIVLHHRKDTKDRP